MAFLVKQKGRPFWLIRYRDGRKGRWVQVSTKLRVDSRSESRQAKELLEEYTAREIPARSLRDEERWERWVPEYLRLRYHAPEAAKTLERYLTVWRNWSIFLEVQAIPLPRLLTHAHVMEYFRWRQQPSDARVRACRFNTALGEAKFMGLLLDEAVRRGFANRNVCRRLGLRRQKPVPKSEFTAEDIKLCLEALDHERDWMRTAFVIALHQGCRLRATSINLDSDVDWQRETVRLHEKGGKVFTVPLHPQLMAEFRRWRAEGRTFTCELPKNASKSFRRLFRKLGRPQLTFHGLRVSVCTWLARAGVPENKAQKFVGHSDTTVHRCYQRLAVEDLKGCLDALPLPVLRSTPLTIPKVQKAASHLPPLLVDVIEDDDDLPPLLVDVIEDDEACPEK